MTLDCVSSAASAISICLKPAGGRTSALVASREGAFPGFRSVAGGESLFLCTGALEEQPSRRLPHFALPFFVAKRGVDPACSVLFLGHSGAVMATDERHAGFGSVRNELNAQLHRLLFQEFLRRAHQRAATTCCYFCTDYIKVQHSYSGVLLFIQGIPCPR